MSKKITFLLLTAICCIHMAACGAINTAAVSDTSESPQTSIAEGQQETPPMEGVQPYLSTSVVVDEQGMLPIENLSVIPGNDKKTYSNASISFEYPGSWYIEESSGEDGNNMHFYDEENGDILSFEQYEAWRIDLEATEDDYKRILDVLYENVTIIELGRTTIADCETAKLVFQYSADGNEYIVIKYLTIAEYVGFEFTHKYPANGNDIYEDAISELLNSVKFTV